jgi:Transglycosylase SLT domain/Sel1 repeat
MKTLLQIAVAAACALPVMGVAAGDTAVADAPEKFALVAVPPAGVLLTDFAPQPASAYSPAASPVHAGESQIIDAHVNHGQAISTPLPVAGGAVAALELAAQQGDAKAQIELALKYAFAEGVPKDPQKSHQLLCNAAKYGNAEGYFNLGWVYANGRGVARDDGVAARLFRMAADRGHEHAPKLLGVVAETEEATLPACLVPGALPLAKALPPLPALADDDQLSPQIPMAPKEITLLVQRLAPQYEVDTNLALAVISAESAFNPLALSPARAQGLMQLIPETAERFGVKRPFNPDENLKGGLAYLRWLLAYFQGDVSLVLAAYNAGEGAVEKHRGIPPYNETRDYVKKIIGMYRRHTHPYNPDIVKPSALIALLKRG